jgi:superfamily II DNA or RNA helicase
LADSELFEAVRAACPAPVWSRAVELVRRLAVSGQTQDDEEIVCRVKVPTRAVPHTVQLYPADAEWACDCDSKADCCEHVAAAAIALKKANAEGQALPSGGKHEARLVHRLTRQRGELGLERVLVKSDGTEIALTTSLASAVARQSAGVTLSPSQQDLDVDRALGQRVGGPLHAELGVSVIKLLTGARNVEFEGAPIEIATEILLPHAEVVDKDGAFEVTIDKDPRLLEVVASGIGRSASGLHLLGELHKSGAKWQALPSRKLYTQDVIATLVTEVLPELARSFKLECKTDKLPALTREERPRAVVQVAQDGERLGALLTLVYGDPPIARIDAGRLVHLSGPIPIRDEALEQRVIARARDELGLNVGGRTWLTGEAAIGLARKLEGWNGELQGVKRKTLLNDTRLEPRLGKVQGQLELLFQGEGELRADPAQVLRAWRNGQNYAPLLEGGFAAIPRRWLDEHASLLERVIDARMGASEQLSKAPAHSLPALAELCDLLEFPTPPELEPFRALLKGTGALPEAQLPKDLNATLRHYQQDGVRWLSLLRHAGLGAVLADDMGLGKTLQAACTLEGRCLVVCPTSVVYNWANELRKFRPGLEFQIYQGKHRALDPSKPITITSYALLRLDREALSAVTWDQVVLDEAQLIKNPESQVARAAYQLKARFRLALSGTPVENRLLELWSLFHFTNPGLLGGRSEFESRYSEPIRLGDQRVASGLRQRIRPFILRRDKRSVAPELPPRTDLFIYCDLDPGERALYTAVHAALQRDVVQELKQGGGVMRALEALLRLRQAACHSALIPGSMKTPAAPNESDVDSETTDVEAAIGHGSSKLRALCEALEQITEEGHKALVFSQWTSLLDLVEPELDGLKIRHARLDGSTRDRQAVVDEFQSTSGPPVLLLSLKAGGTGLNLTAADHVFLLDPWWNPAVEQQAADRAHRIGQERPVFLHRLVARDTVEEKILALQAHKRELAKAALDETALAQALGRDELLELLS